MKLRIGTLFLGAVLFSAIGADRTEAGTIITGWSFDGPPYSVGSTGSTVGSNLGPVAGNGYEIGFTNSLTNPGTNATYTYDSVNAAGNYVNLTATVNSILHPLNSNPAVTGNTATNDILSTASSNSPPSITENTWRVRSTDSANDGNLGFSRAAPQYTQGTQWVTDTAGHSAVSFSFDWFSTKQAVDLMEVQYSTDGTNWKNLASFTANPNTFYSNTSPNITVPLPADAGNENYLGVRLVTAYDPSSGSPDYTGASGGVYNNNSGNWRLDNVEFTDTASAATPEPATLTLLGLGVAPLLGYAWRRRKAHLHIG